MAKDQTMKALLASINEKKKQVDDLTLQIKALQDVYDNISGESSKPKQRAPRSNIKSLVFKLLDQRGAKGLNGNIACELATQQGIDINVKSVSSLLSRLQNDGTLHYDGNVYRLKEFAPVENHRPDNKDQDPVRVLHRYRTSGINS